MQRRQKCQGDLHDAYERWNNFWRPTRARRYQFFDTSKAYLPGNKRPVKYCTIKGHPCAGKVIFNGFYTLHASPALDQRINISPIYSTDKLNAIFTTHFREENLDKLP